MTTTTDTQRSAGRTRSSDADGKKRVCAYRHCHARFRLIRPHQIFCCSQCRKLEWDGEQLDLVLTCVPSAARRSDPSTSKEAARAKAPSARTECERIMEVMRHLAEQPLTYREVAERVGMDPTAAMRRLSWDLIREGKVMKAGQRTCTTRGGGGRRMTTWEAV